MNALRANHGTSVRSGGGSGVGLWQRFTRWARFTWRTRLGGRWWSRSSFLIAEAAILLPPIAYLAWALWGGIVSSESLSWFSFLEDWFDKGAAEYAALQTIGKGLLTSMMAVAVFVGWRLRSARRRVVDEAKARARDYVPTAANSILEDVVGRDELCLAVKDELKVRATRRPHLLVGGVGAGKTAVMVRLTELLAQSRAVPVPVRLRDVGEDDLDFAALGQERFCQVVDDALLGKGWAVNAIGEKSWRWLRKQDRIVVLADGLEEVFAGTKREQDRDNKIRRAVRKAGEEKLPLVIASRPHAPLRDVEAAMVELEPLSEEAALGYIEGGTWSEDEHRLDWVVEAAEVSEAPLYLQVANQLYHADRLEHVAGRRERDTLNTRATDRAGLRYRLLDTWTQSLVDGYLREELALRPQERAEAVVWISALACLGLRHDTIEVKFDDLVGSTDPCSQGLLELIGARLRKIANRDASPATLPVAGDAAEAPRTSDYLRGLQLAATWGEQLQLVEAHGGHVRFQHSLMQAYLGSRCLGRALATNDGDFLARALDPPENASPPGSDGDKADGDKTRRIVDGPSRELLVSLVFLARHESSPDRDDRDRMPSRKALGDIVGALLHAARQRSDQKAVDLYATALEVDRALGWAMHRAIVQELANRWPEFTSQDNQGLLDAKYNVVRRLGDALRGMASESRLHATRVTSARVTTTSITATEVTTTSVTATGMQDAGTTTAPRPSPVIAASYYDFFGIACQEADDAIRLAVAQEIGRGGDDAFVALDPVWASAERHYRTPKAARSTLGDPTGAASTAGATDQARDERSRITAALVAPMLVGSVRDEQKRAQAKDVLRGYVEAVGPSDTRHGLGGPAELIHEVALARGFKAAANRRVRHPDTCREGKAILLELAEELLKVSSFWYTHVSLIHALTLWNLPDSLPSTMAESRIEPDLGQRRSPEMRIYHLLSLAGRNARTPAAERRGVSRRQRPPDWLTAGRWRSWRARKRLHPFVAEAGRLAVKALKTRRPERYIWIDETGIADTIGSQPSSPTQRRVHNLWIPPSTGWTTLDRRAQQLVADVRLLFDLAYRGDPGDHDRYLQRANRMDLPLCLTGDRRPLQPSLSVAKPGKSDPGLSCADGCAFELCPYPPRGEVKRRDVAEAFCRRQQTLLSYRSDLGFHRRPAPWQRPSLWEVARRRRARLSHRRLRYLRKFWAEMADRRTVRRPGYHPR